MNKFSHQRNTTLFASWLLIGLLSAGQAFAQDCEVSVSNSAVDFGRVVQHGANDAVVAGNMHKLGNRSISLNAICPAGSKLELSVLGEHQAEQFKFAQRGNISVSLSNAQLDGRRVDLAQIKTSGAVPGVSSPSLVATPGDLIIPTSGGVTAEGSVLSVQIEVRPMIPVAEFKTRDTKTLEANLSFEVRAY